MVNMKKEKMIYVNDGGGGVDLDVTNISMVSCLYKPVLWSW